MEKTSNYSDFIKDIEAKNYEQYEVETQQRIGRIAQKNYEREQKKQEKAIVEGENESIEQDDKPSSSMIRALLWDSEEVYSENGPEGICGEKPEASIENSQRNEREQKAIEVMRSLIKKNFWDAGKKYHQLERQIMDSELFLGIDENADRENGKFSPRSKLAEQLIDTIESSKEQLDELIDESPESYTLAHGLELREYSKQVKSHEMVTTPYVKNHLEKVERNIANGIPTFIHGHLGGGKTELAVNAAKNASINKVANEEAANYIIKYKKDHPNTSKPEIRKEFGRIFRHYQATFKNALLEGDPNAQKKFAPLMICGSKDLTSQDLFTDKTLKLTKFNGKTLLEHKDDLDAEIAKWVSKHPEEAKDPEKMREEASKILEIYKLKNQAFGTEVETIKKEVYRGVIEGRPVIIDEVNAIPASVLISMNDILTKKPGQTCSIPGEGPTKIQPGFSIIMTGNLSSNVVDYVGTEDLNNAFTSRIDSIEHDYLPMSTTDKSYKEQMDPSKNELFKVAIAYLVDKQGNLELPEMEKSLDKIFELCQLAHDTQLIFEGKWRESQSLQSASGDDIEPRLKTAVLSVRNLLKVLDEWRRGIKKDLDKALWDDFIAGILDGDDQNIVLALAKNHKFFSDEDGWKVRSKDFGAPLTQLEEIHPGPFYHQYSPNETYSVRKVVEVLYGPGPKREDYPDIDFDELDELDDEISLEDSLEYDAKLKEIDTSIRALKVLGEECGCEVNHDIKGE